MPDSLFVDLYTGLWARLFGLERYARKPSPGQLSLFRDDSPAGGKHDVSQEPRDPKGEWTAGGAAPEKTSEPDVVPSENVATLRQDEENSASKEPEMTSKSLIFQPTDTKGIFDVHRREGEKPFARMYSPAASGVRHWNIKYRDNGLADPFGSPTYNSGPDNREQAVYELEQAVRVASDYQLGLADKPPPSPAKNKSADNDIGAKIESEGLNGFSGVLPSHVQKKVFGRALFGKKPIKIDAANRVVTGTFRVGFGQDSSDFEFSFDQIAKMASTKGPTTF